MMKDTKDFSEQTEKLNKENEALQQQLREAKETIDLIKAGNIDALVNENKKDLTIYTDKTADKTYRTLIEKMNEGAVTLNEKGIILYCNSYFAKMINLPLQKVIGTKFKNFIDDTSKEYFDTIFKEGWNSPVKDEIHLNTATRIVKPVLLSINTIELDGAIVSSIILTDLTMRNRDQAELKLRARQLHEKNVELESANKELIFQNEEREKRAKELNNANTDIKELEELIAHKESILAILSHDLRSPLAGIIGTSEYLKSNFEEMDSAEVKEMLDLLYESSKEELNMLDYLVEWARIKYASEVFSPVKIALVQYVSKAFNILTETAALNKIHLGHEIEENISVFADAKMLLSIIQNLISNAIKNSHPGGKINVMAKRKNDEIIVEIKDTGIGMSKRVQEKLFTPQMDTLSEERKYNKGAGIGLLLVKGFLEKNGGRIWVESITGLGSSFYFTLPINKPLANMNKINEIKVNKRIK